MAGKGRVSGERKRLAARTREIYILTRCELTKPCGRQIDLWFLAMLRRGALGDRAMPEPGWWPAFPEGLDPWGAAHRPAAHMKRRVETARSLVDPRAFDIDDDEAFVPWDDEPDDAYWPECINCGAPVPQPAGRRAPECCSPACYDALDEAEAATGTCGGCGRYGRYGESCFRPLDGVMEECGQFV
jgi:hypothetical protein